MIIEGTFEVADRWRDTFYAFERAARRQFEPVEPEPIGLHNCQRVIERAFELYGWPSLPVHLRDGVPGQNVGTCCMCLDFFLIRLPPCRQRPWVALHEAAHAMTWGSFGSHNPLFTQLTIGLWSELGGWPRHELHMLAAEHNVALLVEEDVA